MAEPELRALAAEVEWPPTPDAAGRLALAPRRRRRALAAAVALAAAAIAATFAVPQSRSAVLRFLHLGGVTVERVETLPPAEERPLAAGLGSPVGDAEAALALGSPFRPASHGRLYRLGGFVSTLVAAPSGPALLSEFGSAELIKKLAAGGRVEPVEVAPGVPGLWIAGRPHVVFFEGTSPRLAGNTLVWTSGGVTFRLEGRGLAQPDALRIAREILGTGGR